MSLRIVFMGTPRFAVPSLDVLVSEGHEVVAVVTAPDKPRGRGREISSTPVKEAAVRLGLNLLQPAELTDLSFHQDLRSRKPDLIVVVAFRILPPSVFAIPPKGSFNLHASLLPRYRGAAPINWALIRGDKETGVTTFFLEERVDTGRMIVQKNTPITREDDAGSLHDRLSLLGASAVAETVRLIERGEVRTTGQDVAHATLAPKIFKPDCRIPWNKQAEEVRNFIRGLSPSPAAWTMHRGLTLRLYRTETADGGVGDPGSVTVEGKSLLVQCADQRLAILEVQQEGRKRLAAEEFLRGYPLKTGEHFA
jgi:methionyl-tRNA formyltransferase